MKKRIKIKKNKEQTFSENTIQVIAATKNCVTSANLDR